MKSLVALSEWGRNLVIVGVVVSSLLYWCRGDVEVVVLSKCGGGGLGLALRSCYRSGGGGGLS